MAAQGQRTGLIKTIANLPVEEKFFGVALALLDGFLGVLAGRSTGTQQALLVLAVIFVFLVVVILVWWMRMDQRRRAHAQTLVDSLTEHDKFAEGLADDICEAFEGSLRNDKYTTEADRELPYEILCDAVTYREARSEAEKHFADVMVRRVRVKAQLKGKWAAKDRPL
jgi:ABC-type nickel/cobalt efflux system permease component RcnA